MSGWIRSASDLEALPGTVDAIVVGLGAGGSMALKTLAEAGLSVVGLEEGPHLETGEMSGREEEMMPQLYVDSGAQLTSDLGITVLQGRGVGGSTLHNTNLSKRLPDEILARWRDEFGLSQLYEALPDALDTVEKLLNVHPIPDDDVNANNRVLERGMQALGWKGARLPHNRKDCKGSGFCELGCPNNAKMNAARVLIPAAVEAGAQILTGARARKILHDGKRVQGVEFSTPDGRRRRINAPRVLLGASAIGSAALALASEIPDPARRIGSRLHMHPGAVVSGQFKEKIEGWKGIPQSVECTEHLGFARDAPHRVWIVPGFAHPGAAAGFIPGCGPEHARLMRKYAQSACLIAMLHDHSSGKVTLRGDRTIIDYRLDPEDREQLVLGIQSTARLLLAAGAEQALVATDPPTFFRSRADVEDFTASRLGLRSPALTAVHPMSTMWMGSRGDGVTDEGGKVVSMDGLWVCDGSLFPTSIGGPPQVTIYAMGLLVGRSVAAAA